MNSTKFLIHKKRRLQRQYDKRRKNNPNNEFDPLLENLKREIDLIDLELRERIGNELN